MKTISPYWAALAGLLAIVAQVLIYYVRFAAWNSNATLFEYLMFFLAGALGGWVLIYFLNRQVSLRRRWIVLIAFLLATPTALYVMILGGLFGPLGALIVPQIPWALAAWIGSLVASLIFRKQP